MVTPSMQLIGEALAEVASISVDDALALASGEDALFVDVRERAEQSAGAIAGAVAAPRGFLEFVADPASPMHNPALSSGKRLVVYCASGGRSALAAKTLQDMGYAEVANLTGGFQAWSEAGGPTE
ncbi:MAG: rhodanese-like domain-containing protein [Rhodospirillales bacterium]|nr:rhodanese-like domain-containing protein [Rhodospirillales bacterium]MDE0378589.1 rhodanese-like domain-containing protein [Rhodospirillales bacterium]